MTKTISIACALAVCGCVAGNKAVKEPSAPAANDPVAYYGIPNPGEGWKVLQNIRLETGQLAIFFIQHKTEGKIDGVILVMIAPASEGGPKALATKMRAGDDEIGAVVSDITCSKEDPPLLCEYQGFAGSVGQGGTTNAKVTFRDMKVVKDTAVILGLWSPDRQSAMLVTYDLIVKSLTVKIKK